MVEKLGHLLSLSNSRVKKAMLRLMSAISRGTPCEPFPNITCCPTGQGVGGNNAADEMDGHRKQQFATVQAAKEPRLQDIPVLLLSGDLML